MCTAAPKHGGGVPLHPAWDLCPPQALELNIKQHEEWAKERGLSAAQIIPVQIGGRRFTEGSSYYQAFK